MRSALVATTCALALAASVGLSACGGGDDPTDKIPTSAPALVPPDDANDLASGTGTGATGTTTNTTPAATPDTGADTGGTPDTGAVPDTGGAGDTGAAPDTGGTGDATPNPGGTGNGGGAAPNPGGVTPDAQAGAGSFQGFCDANPGAC